ncbi:PAS domain S-box protein [Sulfurimonas sp.]|uniref:PAS domain S-box protein n=1 Tax=Sulfurimonas sp. TaxID=2022749 RepID=UPI003567E028
MESKDILFDVVNTLSSPVILLEVNNPDYSVLYANEEMQKLLQSDISKETEVNAEVESLEETQREDLSEVKEGEKQKELELTDEFLTLMSSYKNESNGNNLTLYDVEIFGKIYNINFTKNSNRLFIIFAEINIEKLFENITFHDLSGACNAIVVVLDGQGKVVDVNECFLNFVGMKKEDALSKGFFETFIPGDIEVLNHYLQELMTSDSPHQQFVTPMKNNDNEIHRINWQVSKVVKQNQSFIIAVGSDISKFVEQNAILKKQLQSIKVGFDYFPFAVAYMNAKGEFIKMNTSFMKMFRIKDENQKIKFDQIPALKKSIGFEKMNEHVKLIKEMSYKIDHAVKGKTVKLKVNIKMLSGKQKDSKFYILVAQKVTG